MSYSQVQRNLIHIVDGQVFSLRWPAIPLFTLRTDPWALPAQRSVAHHVVDIWGMCSRVKATQHPQISDSVLTRLACRSPHPPELGHPPELARIQQSQPDLRGAPAVTAAAP